MPKKIPITLEREQLIIADYMSGLNCLTIGRQYGYSKSFVVRLIKRLSLKLKPIGHHKLGDYQKRIPIDRDTLLSLYGKTRIMDIADRYEVSRSTVMNWLGFYGIQRRSKSEEQKMIPAHKHGSWKGGVSSLRNMIFSNLIDWKNAVRELYKWKCSMCECGSNLEVHHLRPLRNILAEFMKNNEGIDFTDPLKKAAAVQTIVSMHRIEDGICVCKKCHAKIDEHRHIGNKS